MLRLPWKAWGETDVMLGMAADLHDRLICSCGCGQWRKDARDPQKKDRWHVDLETCYVRRTLNEAISPETPADAVPSVRLLPEGVTVEADEVAALKARFPHLAQTKPPEEVTRG